MKGDHHGRAEERLAKLANLRAKISDLWEQQGPRGEWKLPEPWGWFVWDEGQWAASPGGKDFLLEDEISPRLSQQWDPVECEIIQAMIECRNRFAPRTDKPSLTPKTLELYLRFAHFMCEREQDGRPQIANGFADVLSRLWQLLNETERGKIHRLFCMTPVATPQSADTKVRDLLKDAREANKNLAARCRELEDKLANERAWKGIGTQRSPVFDWLKGHPDYWQQHMGERIAFHEGRKEVLAVGTGLLEVIRELRPEERRDPAVVFACIPPWPNSSGFEAAVESPERTTPAEAQAKDSWGLPPWHEWEILKDLVWTVRRTDDGVVCWTRELVALVERRNAEDPPTRDPECDIPSRRARILAAGHRVGTVQELLSLTDQEMSQVEQRRPPPGWHPHQRGAAGMCTQYERNETTDRAWKIARENAEPFLAELSKQVEEALASADKVQALTQEAFDASIAALGEHIEERNSVILKMRDWILSVPHRDDCMPACVCGRDAALNVLE